MSINIRQGMSQKASADPAVSKGERIALITGLVAILLVNVGLIGFRVAGMPVRAVLAVGFLSVLALQYPSALKLAWERFQSIAGLAFALALLGLFVSLANGVPLGTIGTAIVEVHLQAVVAVLLGAIVAELCGARQTLLAFAGVMGVTLLVAILQFVGLDSVWALREALGNLQGQAMQEFSPFLNRRPMGVSFSPIHFGTQLCLAFAAIALIREKATGTAREIFGLDLWVLVALGVLVIGSIISGNRSPILGAALFFVAYGFSRGSFAATVGILIAGGFAYFAGPMIFDALQSTELRAFRTDDRSSAGRLSLVRLGGLLIADNPLGYGFGFDPNDHWGRFWHELYAAPGAEVVKEAKLHNYALSMLNTYGVGLLLLVPLVWKLLSRARGYLLLFVPYIVHILFHNSGPFWNDNLVWIVIGAAGSALAFQEQQGQSVPRGLASFPQRTLSSRQG